MSIFPAPHAQAEGLVKTWAWSRDSSFRLFICLHPIWLWMPQSLGAGNRWSHVLHQIKKQSSPFGALSAGSAKHAACVYVSCALLCFQVSCQEGGREQGATLLRKPFLKELGSEYLLRWPPQVLRIREQGENGRKNKRTLTSFPVLSCPVSSDQVSYTRGFRAALSAANIRCEKGFREQPSGDASHQTWQSLSWMSSRPYLTTVTTDLSALNMHST